MLKTSPEILSDLGGSIRARRIGMRLTQQEAAARAGVAYRTWRRLETAGGASIEDLVKAALALRCEDGLDQLFPPVAAASLDALLASQKATSKSSPKRVRKSGPRLQIDGSHQGKGKAS